MPPFAWQSNKSYSFSIYVFIEGQLLCKILLFSVKPQPESAIGVHISPSPWTSLPSHSPLHPTRLYRAPVWGSWAIQQIPIGYLFSFTPNSVSAFLFSTSEQRPSFGNTTTNLAAWNSTLSIILQFLCVGSLGVSLLDPLFRVSQAETKVLMGLQYRPGLMDLFHARWLVEFCFL